MPIKPENRARYPANWSKIREAILERANGRCEHPGCGVGQYWVGTWGPHGFTRMVDTTMRTYSEARQAAADQQLDDEPKNIVIVLTVAHLDHQPEHCDPANLMAMCQRHHLAHDAEHHKASAQATRRAKSGNLELEL